MVRIIGHLDMDAFFAAIEERDRPRLKGKPLVVGADPKGGKGRGVVSTANYAARKFGIRSAMPISFAWQLAEKARLSSEEIFFLEGDYNKYRKESSFVMDTLRSFCAIVEPASIDEAYFDLSLCNSFEEAKQIAEKIKRQIRSVRGLTASVGIAPNKLIAKIASDFKKPDGLTVVVPEDVFNFLGPLPISRIPGIGPKSQIELSKMGVHKIQELRKLPESELSRKFGKHGSEMRRMSLGVDDSLLVLDWEAKSIGEQVTFEADISDPVVLVSEIKNLCAGVFLRFHREGFRSFKTVCVTVRFEDFDTKSRSHTLTEPATNLDSFTFECVKMFLPFMDSRENKNKKKIRLVGVRLEKLE